MHCDIKEPNLMLKSSVLQKPAVVIVDGGFAQSTVSEQQPCCGSPGYIPPETWKTGTWYPKGDCFSMGVVALQVLTRSAEGIFTAGATSYEEVRNFTSTREPPYSDVPAEYTEFVPVIKKLLEKQRLSRISAIDASQSVSVAACAS
mmetsp:Transcript_88365/g.254999  ORF Transcript_88365/g.254999 Transcript_88365/m.254999 type:complete len:146 (+) Transcript_88365:2-439(+)